MTYASLQTLIASYLHRSDLTTQIPSFIELAEAIMFRELHIKELQVSVTGATVSGYADLPADFGSVSRVSVTYGNSARTLDYTSLAEAPVATSASPSLYSLENNKLRLWGASDDTAYTLYYIPKIQALWDTNTRNWILDNAQELYLYASALEGAKYIRDNAEVQKLTGMVSASMASVKRFSEKRGQPSTGSMQIKVRNG